MKVTVMSSAPKGYNGTTVQVAWAQGLTANLFVFPGDVVSTCARSRSLAHSTASPDEAGQCVNLPLRLTLPPMCLALCRRSRSNGRPSTM